MTDDRMNDLNPGEPRTITTAGITLGSRCTVIRTG